MTGGAPIQFRDGQGVRWTVARQESAVPGLMRLEFESAAGERRTCEVIALDEDTWAELNEQSWQLLLLGANRA